MTSQQSEKRRFARIAMDSEAHILCERATWQTHLIDLSLKGALLALPSDFDRQVGDLCRIEFILSGSGIVVTMEGHIAHREADHLGFRCDMIDVESMSHLRRLVELNLGDEALLERELAELTHL